MTRRIALAAIFLVSACGTTYEVPTVPPPPAWAGDAPTVPVENSTVTLPGELKEGQAFLRFAVEPARTGVIDADIPYGRDKVIPAGTKVYAQQFSLVMQTTRYGMPVGAARNQNALNDPIEWCTAPAQGPVHCLFWEGPDRIKIIEASGPPLVAQMTSTVGVPGPMAQITEKDVDFGVTVYNELFVDRFRRNNIAIGTRLIRSDGQKRDLGFQTPNWDANRQTSYEPYGGKFLFTAVGDPNVAPAVVKAEVVQAPGRITRLGDPEGTQAMVMELVGVSMLRDAAAKLAPAERVAFLRDALAKAEAANQAFATPLLRKALEEAEAAAGGAAPAAPAAAPPAQP